MKEVQLYRSNGFGDSIVL